MKASLTGKVNKLRNWTAPAVLFLCCKIGSIKPLCSEIRSENFSRSAFLSHYLFSRINRSPHII